MRHSAVRRIDLNLLVAFSELAATGSVTLAASRLGITQSAMSRTLARLRTSLGDPLFLRGPRGLTPTPRAQALMPAVEAWLEQADTLVGGGAPFDPRTAERTFVVSGADYAEAVLLPALLRRLEAEAPRVRLRLATQPLPLETALEKGELDLSWSPRLPTPNSVVWTRLLDESFTFAVRRGHPATKRPFTLDRFCALRHLALAPGGRTNTNPIDELLARMGRKREVVATVPSFLVVPSLLAGSDVGVILPRRIFDATSSRYALEALPLPFRTTGFSLSQGWHERVRKDSGHAWFRQLVVEVARTV